MPPTSRKETRRLEQKYAVTESEKTMAGSGIVEVYSKRAAKYDITANLYYLIGVRVDGYRKRTVEALKLQPGQRVLDLACGTGANFPWLEQAVGPRGQILGLDFTPDMLSEARKGTEKNGWANVGLVQDDAAHFNFPAPLDGVICTYAISLIPNFADVIQKAATALKYGGRMAILDVRHTSGTSHFLNAVADFLTKPFGSSEEVLRRRPWEEMPKYLSNVQFTELYLGFLYIAVGTKLDRAKAQ